MQEILDDMETTRKICNLVHKARNNAGFNSLKYPLISVKTNKYLLPGYRDLIADECNLIGYMDIPAVEYVMEFEEENQLGKYETDGIIKVWLDTTKSSWQDELFNKRVEERRIIEERIKNNYEN